MEKFIDFIESQMSGVPDGPFLYKFKRKTLDEMNGRASEVEARGLHDKNVIDDLIISEHPDLKSDYKKFALESKRKNASKRRWLTNSIGSVLYLIILLCTYLGMSFHTHNWEKTWVFMVGGVLLWVVYLLSLFIIRISRMRQIFHIFSSRPSCLSAALNFSALRAIGRYSSAASPSLLLQTQFTPR